MDNNENNISQRLDTLEKNIEFLVGEAKIARRNRRIVLILTMLFVVLPAVGLLVALPSIMSQMTSMYQI